MNLEIKRRPALAMRKIANWIEERNTEGAGDRWLTSCIEELTHMARIDVNYTICKDPKLAKYQYRCFTYKDKWIVAYKVIGDKFIVYRFLYGRWLTYVPTTI